MNNDIIFTPIQNTTVNIDNIIKLYSNLTTSTPITSNQFNSFLNSLHSNEKIFVMTDACNTLLGLGSILIERKLIHGISKVGHIEDIVISPNHRKKGYGKLIIDYLTEVAKKENCYKVILNCKENLEYFYGKCGFEKKNIEMSKYFMTS